MVLNSVMLAHGGSIAPFGIKKSHGDDFRRYHKNQWKGLKLTTEEMVFVKYMYHDRQKVNLDEFIAVYSRYLTNDAYKAKMPDWNVHMIDEANHLKPYILIYSNALEYFWLVTYNMGTEYDVGEFSLSYHKREEKSTRVWSAGYVAFTADDAVKLFIRMFQSHGKNLTEPSAKK
jgi:hypothetical protein